MKKKVMIVSVLGLLLLVGGFVWLGMTTSASVQSCDIGLNDNMACFELGQTMMGAIYTDPTNPEPLTPVTVVMGLEIPYYANTISSAELRVYNSNGVYDVWSVDSLVGDYGGMSVQLSSEFIAPFAPGEYNLKLTISGSGTPDYVQETVFNVGSSECPSDYCTSWNFIGDVTGGYQEGRQCITYDSPPDCNDDTEWQYRTICSDDYHCNGYTSDVCDVLTYCVSDVGEVTCYWCDGSDLHSQKFTGECPAGTTPTAPNCDSSCPTDCNDNNLCTEDSCVNAVCVNVDKTCSVGEYCELTTGNCVVNDQCLNVECGDGECNSGCGENTDNCAADCGGDLCVGKNCTDDNLCTTDSCSNGICVNLPLRCESGYYCNPDTGDCEQPPACMSASDCDDMNKCTEDKCVDGVCSFTPIEGCGVGPEGCYAYEVADPDSEDGCKFSLEKLFTKSGTTEFWDNNKVGVVVAMMIILVFVVVMLQRQRNSLGGF